MTICLKIVIIIIIIIINDNHCSLVQKNCFL